MPKKTTHIKSGASRKKVGWRGALVSSKQKKKNKLAVIVIVTIILILVFGQAIKFADSLFQPITTSSFQREYSWDGKSNLNLVIKSEDIAVLSLDPFEKKITLVNIPPGTYVDVPGGFGKWQVRAIYDLGQAEDAPVGDKLLVNAMSTLLGIPIDGIIEIKDQSGLKSPYDFITQIKNNPYNIFSHIQKINSNLTKVEFAKLILNISKIRFDKILNLDPDGFNLLKFEELSDGTEVLVAEPILLDNFVSERLSESRIKEEQISVAVFNGTKVPGLAQKATRMITNMGGDVIISANAPFVDLEDYSELEKSFIITMTSGSSYTAHRLSEIFNLDCTNNPNCDKMYVDKIFSRAQINVVLGKDFVTSR